MIASLPLFHLISGKTVLVVGSGEAADAKRRLVERTGAIVIDEVELAKAQGARLAFVALEDGEEARLVADELRAAGMLINVPDRPELCDFTVPSILDRDPVLIAVGTGGASAGLAKHLRLRLERILPQRLGELAKSLFSGRDALRSRFPDASERRRAIDDALREGGQLDPLVDHGKEEVENWVGGAANPADNNYEEINLISADPDDLTLKQARWLGEADTLLLDGEIPAAILARARADAIRELHSEAAGQANKQGLTLTLRYRS
jgi:uroporphyrin-III C-methyltransferase/precorrin-2 dehydrogenase/sirohydrochlorin ferrochelatase